MDNKKRLRNIARSHVRPAKKDTKEHGQMLKIIFKLQEGEVLEKKKSIARKGCKRLREELEDRDFMTEKEL